MGRGDFAETRNFFGGGGLFIGEGVECDEKDFDGDSGEDCGEFEETRRDGDGATGDGDGDGAEAGGSTL